MNKYRIFVEKKSGYQTEAKSLLNEIKSFLKINIEDIRVLNIYDIFNISKELLDTSKKSVFSEVVTDIVYDDIDLTSMKYFAVEFLPGQFDQRADSAKQCISLIDPTNDVIVKSGQLIILIGDITDTDINRVKKYYINEVESREKDLNALEYNSNLNVEKVKIYSDFNNLDNDGISKFKQDLGLAMSNEDLLHIQNYFINNEYRNPTETEILMLDTYWSDHCRHTTFETILENIKFSKDKFSEQIEKTFEKYIELRNIVHDGKKPMTLMDMATICGKYERKMGNLEDLEVSDEINACSVFIDVDHDDKLEKWLLMFKNETHNHPTEIEPFGGASTCIGGAIRDPLSGRSYVYQAMRVTGAADITEDIEGTIQGKLPQRVISKVAADGYSSYGNQIGLATTHVREIYHDGYKAKRMEVGAVVGAVPAKHVRRSNPNPGDFIILLGGRTGRDGVGGATGSSKEHTEKSIETSSAEVQKGNAPEERKIQRLFRNPDVTKLIKKSNDFGAGGVSVAVGELADGLEVNLDKVPTKYKGLNGTEIAISESQERMAVVVEEKDANEFIKYANMENIEATIIAKVTNTNRLVMHFKRQKIVDISRDFINTNGVKQRTNVLVNEILDTPPFNREVKGENLKDKILNNLQDLNVTSQKGLIEMFDSTIGASTVLMPFGGKYQLTESCASVQKIPVIDGNTKTCSIMSFGYDPYISKWSPYHGAAYAVLESIAKVVATGASYKKIRFTFQEYFERLNKDDFRWGKPFAALLGSIYMQNGFNLPAIGGKDSMSGTFKDISVPPTLISFAVTTEHTDNIITSEFKESGNYVYIIKHSMVDSLLPNIEELKDNYDYIYDNVKENKIISAYPVRHGGLSEALVKMSLGNKVGININTDLELFTMDYGSIVVESVEKLDYKNAILLGKTEGNNIVINGESVTHNSVIESWEITYSKIYPTKTDNHGKKLNVYDYNTKQTFKGKKVDEVNVFVPIFPGTNCDYDTMKAFNEAGGNVKTFVFKNQSEEDILYSISKMKDNIKEANIIVISGGFSAGDEPDGSGKFIANILNNEEIKEAIHEFLDNDGLMLGICNGFQALVKSGLLPYGRLGMVNEKSPTLTKNNINRHISHITTTRVTSNNSPWLSTFKPGEIHKIAVSHGEGKFVVSGEYAEELFKNGQVAFQYSDFEGNPTMNGKYNPNGSSFAIEGITSKCGRILGKMGHSERKGDNVYKNIPGNKEQNIFRNAINYFIK